MAKKKHDTKSDIKEEYYQISPEIYSSFSKYRPPVSLYQFREDIQVIYPFSTKGQRLTEEQVEQAISLCESGILFIAHSDWELYAEHIVHQLDLLLLDSSFNPAEVGEVMVRALTLRYANFIEQPVVPVYEKLYADFMVCCQYLWEDHHRIRYFLRYVHTGKYEHATHAVNSLLIGAWIFLQTQENATRRMFDRALLGFYLHDVGMSKVSAHILSKTSPLKMDEVDKVRDHIMTGVRMMQKINIVYDELTFAITDHHERIDGSGYPKKSKAPTLIGKITAIADSLSAMIQTRVYAEAKPVEQALEELYKLTQQYDSNLMTPLKNAQHFHLFTKPAAVKKELLPPHPNAHEHDEDTHIDHACPTRLPQESQEKSESQVPQE